MIAAATHSPRMAAYCGVVQKGSPRPLGGLITGVSGGRAPSKVRSSSGEVLSTGYSVLGRGTKSPPAAAGVSSFEGGCFVPTEVPLGKRDLLSPCPLASGVRS